MRRAPRKRKLIIGADFFKHGGDITLLKKDPTVIVAGESISDFTFSRVRLRSHTFKRGSGTERRRLPAGFVDLNSWICLINSITAIQCS